MARKFARKQRQLSYKIEELSRQAKSEGLGRLLRRELIALLQEFARLAPWAHFKRLSKQVALTCGLLLPLNNIAAQNFAFPQINPLGLNSFEGAIFSFSQGDVDADGDLDILFAGYTYSPADSTYIHAFYFSENIGTDAEANYASPIRSPFDLSAIPEDLIATACDLKDIDNDGDLDILTTTYNLDDEDAPLGIQYFENIGTEILASFAEPVMQVPEDNNPQLILRGRFIDFDNDGDFDCLFGGMNNPENEYDNFLYAFTPVFGYSENVGDVFPEYSPIEIIEVNIDPLVIFQWSSLPSPVDFDEDGDWDIFFGSVTYDFSTESYGQSFFYLENTGDVESYEYGNLEINPFGLPESFSGYTEFSDIDSDGDLDLMTIGTSYTADDYLISNFYFLENIGTDVGIEFEQSNSIQLTPNPTQGHIEIVSKTNLKSINLYDANGHWVKQYDPMTMEVSLASYPNGVYFLKMIGQDGELCTKKIVKL